MGIGANLQPLRSKTIKYSQQDIADLLDIARTTYIKWANGTSNIKSQFIPKLAEIFNVEISKLFEEDKLQISNNNFDNKDNSTGITVFNFYDNATAEKLGDKIDDLLKSIK